MVDGMEVDGMGTGRRWMMVDGLWSMMGKALSASNYPNPTRSGLLRTLCYETQPARTTIHGTGSPGHSSRVSLGRWSAI